VISPKKIVLIGLSTLDLFGGETVTQKRIMSDDEKPRILGKRGVVFNRDALAVLHLSGARISRLHRNKIAQEILAFA